jgi:ribonuclease P protein subunit RPR2
MSMSLNSKLVAMEMRVTKREAKMKSKAKQIAQQRIKILFQQAKETFRDNPQLSKRYIELARRIDMATRMRLPTVYRHQICKSCHSLLVQSENCRVRIRQRREPHVVITCLSCGHKTRMPLKQKKERNKIEQDNHQDETTRKA